MKIRENMIIPFEKIPGCLAFKVKVTIEVQFLITKYKKRIVESGDFIG